MTHTPFPHNAYLTRASRAQCVECGDPTFFRHRTTKRPVHQGECAVLHNNRLHDTWIAVSVSPSLIGSFDAVAAATQTAMNAMRNAVTSAMSELNAAASTTRHAHRLNGLRNYVLQPERTFLDAWLYQYIGRFAWCEAVEPDVPNHAFIEKCDALILIWDGDVRSREYRLMELAEQEGLAVSCVYWDRLDSRWVPMLRLTREVIWDQQSVDRELVGPWNTPISPLRPERTNAWSGPAGWGELPAAPQRRSGWTDSDEDAYWQEISPDDEEEAVFV